jgi:O-antigen biosynthesis protein
MLIEQYLSIQPLSVYTAPGPRARLNLVTDSINSGSLFGGVGTAIILAATLAKQRNAKLRVVTRTQTPDEAGLAQVLDCNDIMFSGNIEFAHVAVGDKHAQLDICEGDRFLTTSWWTTASVLGSVSAHRVDYLLQEDERMFYPYGDEWLRCSEVMGRRDIRLVVNTELLYRHLLENGFAHLTQNAVWFEPAFPKKMFAARVGHQKNKRKLFFYARPNNLRNLFYRGIEVLDKAVSEGVIDPAKWDVFFLGKDIPKLKLGGVLEPIILPTMGWREYGEFISNIDVGFCLMCTPHPSYPPLDLAAAGAYVLTNRFGLKHDLSRYSTNIMCADLSVHGLLDGLRSVLARAQTGQARAEVADSKHMPSSWTDSLANVVEFLR